METCLIARLGTSNSHV
ncbi:TPA: hypothetical protein ANIA_11661 [Aspergillus nidulans FGSC A4]|uniref:Uncharacterized protein n=1 Tax=Emericella nidulans (strain FGSC A4 / ATCC 38163 / CBS 112.46 / NRRL 194 / M139) TaxID=227321 RepID=C8VRL6_EMENI|nr:TPA: hypothetical protein ANIA_11661 [Aspergillus nidulans FGSC A4]